MRIFGNRLQAVCKAHQDLLQRPSLQWVDITINGKITRVMRDRVISDLQAVIDECNRGMPTFEERMRQAWGLA